MPTRSEPARPGPYVTATASTSSQLAPASAHASSRTGTIQRRCARAATSGTIPPVGAWRATCDATTLAWISRPSSMRAMPVSSHDDSTDRISPPLTGVPSRVLRPGSRWRWRGIDGGAQPGDPFACRCVRQRVGRHDQGILAVVAVVARTQADRPEAELLVEPAGRQVRQPYLERGLVGAAVGRQVEERQEQPLPDVLAAPLGMD